MREQDTSTEPNNHDKEGEKIKKWLTALQDIFEQVSTYYKTQKENTNINEYIIGLRGILDAVKKAKTIDEAATHMRVLGVEEGKSGHEIMAGGDLGEKLAKFIENYIPDNDTTLTTDLQEFARLTMLASGRLTTALGKKRVDDDQAFQMHVKEVQKTE